MSRHRSQSPLRGQGPALPGAVPTAGHRLSPRGEETEEKHSPRTNEVLRLNGLSRAEDNNNAWVARLRRWRELWVELYSL